MLVPIDLNNAMSRTIHVGSIDVECIKNFDKYTVKINNRYRKLSIPRFTLIHWRIYLWK